MRTLLLASILLLLSACTNFVNDEIPLIIYDRQDHYMRHFENQIQAAAGKRITIRSYDSKNSQSIQNEIIEDLLENDPPLLIINPVDRLSVFPMVDKANQLGIPIIFINREPLRDDIFRHDAAYYIGADPKESAQLQAEMIIELFGGNETALNSFDKNGDNAIQTIILMGQQGHQDAEQRTKYVLKHLEDAGFDIDLLDIHIANFNREEAYEITLELADIYGDNIELIISNNDAMAVGAIDALLEMGIIKEDEDGKVVNHSPENWLPVIGIDGLDIATNLIETGHIFGTVINDSETMAKAIVALADYLSNEKSLENYPYEITDGRYIWINYRKFALESSSQEEDDDEENDKDIEEAE